MSYYDHEKRLTIVRDLYLAVSTWKEQVGSGTMPFDYAVKAYIRGHTNELSAGLEAYVKALGLGDEKEKQTNEEQDRINAEIRRKILLDFARKLDIPELTSFVKGLLESLYYRQSLYWTLHGQTESLGESLAALESGKAAPPNLCALLGPLAVLYADPTVVEIVVDAPQRVRVVYSATGNQLQESEVGFDNQHDLRAAIDGIMALGGVTLTVTDPTGEVNLPDRTHAVAVIPPVAIGSAYLYLEKVDPAKATFTWDLLLKMGTITSAARDLLTAALELNISLLVVGDTPNPKNYLLNLLAESVGGDKRVIVVADSSRLPVAHHPGRIHLIPGHSHPTSAAEMIEIATHMRPDWLVCGDLRGDETMALLQAILAGHPALSTISAPGSLEGLAQIEAQCLMSHPNLGLAEIRRVIAAAIPLVVYMKNYSLPDQRMRISQVSEISGVQDNRYIIQPLFNYDHEKGILLATPDGESWVVRQHRRIVSG